MLQYLAEKLDLKLEKIMSGADEGNHPICKGTEINCPTAQIVLVTKNGLNVTITVHIVPKIAINLQRVPFNFTLPVDSSTLADTCPKDTETCNIDLLLGNDYYSEFVLSDKKEIKPGLYLLASKFGWLLHSIATAE